MPCISSFSVLDQLSEVSLATELQHANFRSGPTTGKSILLYALVANVMTDEIPKNLPNLLVGICPSSATLASFRQQRFPVS
jgi:hypothetical protein